MGRKNERYMVHLRVHACALCVTHGTIQSPRVAQTWGSGAWLRLDAARVVDVDGQR